jgi:hypothetical protein
MAIAASVFVSAPAVVAGIALARVARTARVTFLMLALLGLAWTFMSWNEIDVEMQRALQLIISGADRGNWQGGTAAAWPHIWRWWLYAAPLCFSLALAIGLLGHRSVDELREREERRVERTRAKAERKARKALGTPERRTKVDPTFDLGHHVALDHVLPHRGNRALMPLSRL